MQTVHRITNGTLITYVTPGMTPSTNALLGKTLPVVSFCPTKKVVKRMNLITGEKSSHCSAKTGFSTPETRREELSRDAKKEGTRLKRNAGRKPEGKKPSRTTIRGMYIN
jgi:hypothetical protein